MTLPPHALGGASATPARGFSTRLSKSL